MREVIVKLFKFDELSDKAKEKAREWWRECEARDFGGHGELWEPAQTAAKILGIEFADRPVTLMGGGTRIEPDIRYSGFWSQGDGASFVGSYSYAKGAHKAIRKEFPEDAKLHAIADGLLELQKKHGYGITAKITQRGPYAHKYTMNFEVYFKDGEYADAETDEAISELMRDFAEWIYRYLEKEYEYRMTDENADESIRINEYDFLDNGERSDG